MENVGGLRCVGGSVYVRVDVDIYIYLCTLGDVCVGGVFCLIWCLLGGRTVFFWCLECSKDGVLYWN